MVGWMDGFKASTTLFGLFSFFVIIDDLEAVRKKKLEILVGF
jgi:hypothetical protein